MGLTERLREEHEKIRKRLIGWDDLLAELESGIGTFAALKFKDEANWVQSEISQHIDAEDELVIAVLKGKSPESVETLEQLLNDHKRLRELISQIAELAWKRQLGVTTNAQVQEALKTFRWRLLDHLAKEEGSLLPLLSQNLTVDEDTELLRRWTELKVGGPSQAVGLTDLNGKIHALLDELLLRHLEALTALKLNEARKVWGKFANGLLSHARAEDEVALPIYSRLGIFPEGGKPSLFDAEHKGIERMLKSLTQLLDELSPNEPSLRRKVVTSLDKYMLLRHLIEHHTLREQNIFYPILDEKASDDEKQKVSKALKEATPVIEVGDGP